MATFFFLLAAVVLVFAILGTRYFMPEFVVSMAISVIGVFFFIGFLFAGFTFYVACKIRRFLSTTSSLSELLTTQLIGVTNCFLVMAVGTIFADIFGIFQVLGSKAVLVLISGVIYDISRTAILVASVLVVAKKIRKVVTGFSSSSDGSLKESSTETSKPPVTPGGMTQTVLTGVESRLAEEEGNKPRKKDPPNLISGSGNYRVSKNSFETPKRVASNSPKPAIKIIPKRESTSESPMEEGNSDSPFEESFEVSSNSDNWSST